MKELTYCKSWFRAKKVPLQIWDEGAAREAHQKRLAYTVLVGNIHRPYCFIEINNNFFGVCFLDDKLREKLNYQFQEIESGKLFLSLATFREFDGDTDKVLIGTTYIFSQDGSIQIRKETFDPHLLEISNTNGSVSDNYEEYPKFGNYSHLTVLERL
jgi:hypothetical protein